MKIDEIKMTMRVMDELINITGDEDYIRKYNTFKIY